MGVEIERKFKIDEIPFDLERYSAFYIEQGYLSVSPSIRVRRQDDEYYMTYKGDRTDPEGIGHTEYNLPLDEDAFDHLLEKADGVIICKMRYLIPLNTDAYDTLYLQTHPETAQMIDQGKMKIELDVFEVPSGLVLAEVEFPSEEAARAYRPAAWFAGEVTGDPRYSNAMMSRGGFFPDD